LIYKRIIATRKKRADGKSWRAGRRSAQKNPANRLKTRQSLSPAMVLHRRRPVLHTFCGQDCVQAGGGVSKCMIPIGIFVMRKNAAVNIWKFGPDELLGQTRFCTRSVDKIVSNELDSKKHP
jgi:hypothetical protein